MFGRKPEKRIKRKEFKNVEIPLNYLYKLGNFKMRHKRLRQKLKEIGYKDEIIDKIIDFYTK